MCGSVLFRLCLKDGRTFLAPIRTLLEALKVALYRSANKFSQYGVGHTCTDRNSAGHSFVCAGAALPCASVNGNNMH